MIQMLHMTPAQVEAHNERIKTSRLVKGKSSMGEPKVEKPPKVVKVTKNRKLGRGWGYEERLERELALIGITGGEREYRWLPNRKYRADIAFVKERLLIEIEGEAHRVQNIFHNDISKGQEALFAGWRMLRVSTRQVRDGTAVGIVKRALGVVMIGEFPANDIPFHGGPKA